MPAHVKDTIRPYQSDARSRERARHPDPTDPHASVAELGRDIGVKQRSAHLLASLEGGTDKGPRSNLVRLVHDSPGLPASTVKVFLARTGALCIGCTISLRRISDHIVAPICQGTNSLSP